MELLNSLFPISSRTLVARLRDMENDNFIDRTDFGGNPPHIEYALTQRGFLLLPLLDSLRQLGMALGCNDCHDRRDRQGSYCESCPLNQYSRDVEVPNLHQRSPDSPSRRQKDDSI